MLFDVAYAVTTGLKKFAKALKVEVRELFAFERDEQRSSR